MSSNEEKAVMETLVSPVVSTSSSDPLSSPEEDKCLLTPLSLEFDPLSWKLDENKSNNCSPEHCSPATAALIDDSVQSKDLMSDSVLSCDLLTMDDNCDQNTNHLNGEKCEINGQLIKEFEPTLNCDFESNGWPTEAIVVQQNNLINLNAVNQNDSESDVTTDVTINSSSLSVETNGLEKQSPNECQIASVALSNTLSSEESTNQSISLMSELSEQIAHNNGTDHLSGAVNVESAHVIATKLANECLSNALHENAIHSQTDQTLNSSSSLSDSSLSDHMSSDSVESVQSASQSSSGSTRKKKKNRMKSKGQSAAPKAQPSAPLELSSQQNETTYAKTNSIEANNKSVDNQTDNRILDTKPEVNGRPKKYEIIIRENTPQELPPEVVRSNSRVEEHFENLTVNLANIRNRFEKGLEDNRNSQSPNLDKSNLKRSQSIHLRMQKYQSAVSGEKDIDSSDDEINEKDIKDKPIERVVFSELSSLKSQWETGSVSSTSEEAERNKEELENLRKNLSLGRSESLKQVYERAIKESNVTDGSANRSDAVVMDSAVKIGSIKEKFEAGKVETETEEERIERLKRERDEEIQSIAERESAAKEARNKFKQIDATATKGHTPQQNGHSTNTNGVTKKPVNGEVIKSGEAVGDDVTIDSAQLQQRRSYFENLPKEAPKEPKRHQITPPRDVVHVLESKPEESHNPNIVKSSDVIEDIPKVDTAKKMLTKFKALENQTDYQSNGGPKPLKRITPPRDCTDSKDKKKEPSPERDSNIIRSSLKTEDDIKVEPEKARNLKAKFENWSAEIDRQNSKNNGYDDEEEFIPHIDTTKNLRKKFETAFKEERAADNKPKVRVNRFVCETSESADLCYVCRTKLYPMEKLEFSGIRLHKNCFRCIKCKCNLRLDNFTTTAEKLYCIPHYKQLFMERGNYDEGFGLEQHKDKWNNKCINNNDLIVNNNNSSLICDENANDSHIDYSNQSVSDASDNEF